MRALALHPDVILLTSGVWQTNCVAIRGGEECFLVDSPIMPDELDALPSLLEQAHFPLSGLLVTHADWDHLLGRVAFPEAALGCAESSAERLAGASGQAQRELRAFDEQHYIRRERPLALGSIQPLPVPGRCEIGERELELLPADGHTGDGMAIHLPWAGLLICGDYLSPLEIPSFARDGGSLDGYVATLERLRALLERIERVVPGHGQPLDKGQALGLLEEDLAYLGGLRDLGEQAPLPDGRRSQAQRRLHLENVAALPGAPAEGAAG